MRARRVDANQADVVAALRAAGASVEIIEEPLDLLVGYRGRTVLMEVKNPNTVYGRKGLNDNQREFMRRWLGGPICIIPDTEAAIRVLEVIDADVGVERLL